MSTPLLQSADSEDRIGPFANLQPGVARAALAGAGDRPKFFDYPLPFAEEPTADQSLLLTHQKMAGSGRGYGNQVSFEVIP